MCLGISDFFFFGNTETLRHEKGPDSDWGAGRWQVAGGRWQGLDLGLGSGFRGWMEKGDGGRERKNIKGKG
jgi:hypothetical protein